MDQVSPPTEDFVVDCQKALGEGGRLRHVVPGFVAREAQQTLTMHIATAIEHNELLVAEAGTGTGKTFAYLVPCLLSNKKTLIATATKTLQDQLFYKDLPLLLGALGLSKRVQNLKGRANYICRYRTRLHAEEGHFTHASIAQEVLLVQKQLSRMVDGERGELPEIAEDAAVWPYVTSTADNCLGTECDVYQTCFLVKARRRALEADLVVTNHHLYFADSQLKDDGLGDLLPSVEVVVLDEAHQLPEIATYFQSTHWSTRQCRDLMNDVLREWPMLDLAQQPLKQWDHQLDIVLDDLWRFIPDETRFNAALLEKDAHFKNFCLALIECWDAVLSCMATIELTAYPGLLRCQERLKVLKITVQAYGELNPAFIRWVERFKHSVVFHTTPLDVSTEMMKRWSTNTCATIFTSATLTAALRFDCFTRSMGLMNAKTLWVDSPFDFNRQALLYMPRGMPDPKDRAYITSLIHKALPLIRALGGRCFFLFTSHHALQEAAKLLALLWPHPLLVQGQEAKSILLERFRQDKHPVLLGTASFWEGVDVKGEALSCVIIDKLPFASPADPITYGRMQEFKAQGLSGFDEWTLPQAILTLKQGVGRLIRDVNDRGILMIADPRLTARAYGALIFKSLPMMKKTREEQKAIDFIKHLELSHEVVGT